MILVFYGTKEARDLIKLLKEENFTVYAAVATEYGKELALEGGASEVLTEDLNEQNLIDLIRDKNIRVIVDGSHPFSDKTSLLAQRVCEKLNLSYIRYERENLRYPESGLIYPVHSIEEAAEKASELGKVIFLTTGSYNLDRFLAVNRAKQKRVVVRVIPEYQVIKKCRDLGLKPKDIIAMQGPFSTKTNMALFKAVNAEVVVTKDSGVGGGTDTKIAAALELELPVVLLSRKNNAYPNEFKTINEVLFQIKQLLSDSTTYPG